MTKISDKDVMFSVKNGELDMLSLIFDRYNNRLYAFFFQLTNRKDISEDLVQSVFERILKYRSSYTGNGKFSTWIFRIARNLYIDYYNNDLMNQVDYLSNGNYNDNKAENHETEFQSDANQNLEILQYALDNLDPVKKQTVLLSRYEGFKYYEIAEIMDCSESAVKVRIFRALKEMKEIINKLNKKEKL